MLAICFLFLFVGHSLAENNPWTGQAKDAGWMKRHTDLLAITHAHANDLKMIFLGDSITDGWQWSQKARDIWAKWYTPRHAYNYGISGDRTENVVWRIQNKEFDGLKAKVAVLMIGTNNLWSGITEKGLEDIAHGVKEILTELEKKMPGVKIILLGVFPRGEPLGQKAKQLNVSLKKFADGNTVHWLDMWSAFESPEGHQKTELYVSDKLHLNEAGYAVWQKTMEPLLNQLLPLH